MSSTTKNVVIIEGTINSEVRISSDPGSRHDRADFWIASTYQAKDRILNQLLLCRIIGNKLSLQEDLRKDRPIVLEGRLSYGEQNKAFIKAHNYSVF